MSGKQVLLLHLKRNFSVTKQLNRSGQKSNNGSRLSRYVKYPNIYEEHTRSGRDATQRLLNKGRKLMPYDKRFPVTGKNTGPGVEGGSELAQELAAVKRVPALGFVNKSGVYKRVPEMETEFVVPDLSDFNLRPYVPYDGVTNISKGKHTARELFDAVYAEDIKQTFYALPKENDLESINKQIQLKQLLKNPNEKILSAEKTQIAPTEKDEKTVKNETKRNKFNKK